MRTNVYIDSFNLYYGCLRKTPHKWPDIATLARRLLPVHEIQEFRFYTARVKSRPSDPTQAERQQIYFRALATSADFTFHFGKFSTKATYRARVDSLFVPDVGGEGDVLDYVPGRTLPGQPSEPSLVRVWTTQEKGSDVNLATDLLVEGFDGRYEMAVIVSGATDLLGPIRAVRERLGLRICVVNPARYSRELQNAAHEYLVISEDDLRECQFPAVLKDRRGTFHKPPSW